MRYILLLSLFCSALFAQTNTGIRSLNGSLNNSQRLTVDSTGVTLGWALLNGVHTLEMPFTRLARLDFSAHFDSVITVPSVQFDTTEAVTGNTGLLRWNSADGTLDLGLGGNEVTLQVGQEMHIRAVNKTGATITDGSLVYITGSQGNRPTVAPAQADSGTTAGVIGMATQDIANNAEGYITTYGYVRQLNTSAYTEGTRLYLSATSAGGWTDTTSAPGYGSIAIGYVTNQHATQGSILVELDKNGRTPITTKTANYTATQYDYTILVSCSSADITITLPPASLNFGRIFHIKKIDATGYRVIVDGNSSELIDGYTTVFTSTRWTNFTLHCTGTGWVLL